MQLLFNVFTLDLPEFIKRLLRMSSTVIFSGKPAVSLWTKCTHFKQANERER